MFAAKPERQPRPPKLKLPDLLPVVNREPRTGQITKKPYPCLEMVDSTRIDEKHRLTREQVGVPVPLGIRRGRHVKTLVPEVQYRTDYAPKLQFRLDSWLVSRLPDGGSSWMRRTYIKLSLSGVRDLVGLFGGSTGKVVKPEIAMAVEALREARVGYHQRRNAAIAEVEAAQRGAKPPGPTKPSEPTLDAMLDMDLL